jgi:DNA end-binding protein Ku
MATTVWKGFLSFGLLSIPVRLYSAARSERISLNQLHSVCKSRIKMPLFCPVCDRKVERSEIVKGYEYDKDQYVLFDENELDQIEPDSSRTMEILEFVKLDEVDPLYFEASYYMTPEPEGKKAYFLLQNAMQDSNYSAIAKLTMHQREHTVIIRPHQSDGKTGLTLHTMFYQNEIREVAEYGAKDHVEVSSAEKKLATQLIENLAGKFEPEKYKDDYRESMLALISAKQQGKEVAPVTHPVRAPVIDLMDALKKSLEQKRTAPKKPPVRAVPAATAKDAKKIKKA